MNRNETLAKIEVETKTNTNININNKDKLEGNSLKNKESQNPKEKKMMREVIFFIYQLKI